MQVIKTNIDGVMIIEPRVFKDSRNEFCHPEADGGISILDNSLQILMRIPSDKAILSEKDNKHPLLKYFDSPFKV